jgi:hypothetical protein
MHLIERRLRQIKMIGVYMLSVAARVLLMRMRPALSRIHFRRVVPGLSLPLVFRHFTKLTRLSSPLPDFKSHASTIDV